MKSDYEAMKSNYEAIKSEFKNFNQSAVANLSGLRSTLRSTTLAWSHMLFYMQFIGNATAKDKKKWEDRRKEARRLVIEVLNEIKPDDKIVLSLANSIYGVILYFDTNFEGALDVLRMAVQEDSKNFQAAYNVAGCACKLADALDEKGDDYKGQVTSLENEALTSLEGILQLQPWRNTEVRNDGDFRRLHAHPRFRAATFADIKT